MKTLIAFLVILGMILVAIGMAQGWIHFSKDDSKATIEIETGEFKQATDEVTDEGKHLLRKAGESLENVGERLEESMDESNTDAGRNSEFSKPPVP